MKCASVMSSLLASVCLLVCSCGRQSDLVDIRQSDLVDIVFCYEVEGGVRLLDAPFSNFARWNGAGWEWLASGDAPDSGVFAVWNREGGIEPAVSGRYDGGKLLSRDGSVSSVDVESLALRASPPIRWAGQLVAGEPDGVWFGFGPSGAPIWICSRGNGDRVDTVTGLYESGGLRLTGRFHLYDPFGLWSAWAEDGTLLYHGLRHGPNEVLAGSGNYVPLSPRAMSSWCQVPYPKNSAIHAAVVEQRKKLAQPDED
jgi:hypothetical protein